MVNLEVDFLFLLSVSLVLWDMQHSSLSYLIKEKKKKNNKKALQINSQWWGGNSDTSC